MQHIPQQSLIQWDMYHFAAPLGQVAAAGVIHENASDHLGAQGKKVHAVFAANAARQHLIRRAADQTLESAALAGDIVGSYRV